MLLTLVLVAVSVTATYAVTRFILLPRRKPDYEGATGSWQKEAEARTDELSECLAQQAATSQILRVISSSPSDLQPVLDALAESAARLCDARDANILRVEGEHLRVVSHYGVVPTVPREERFAIQRDSSSGRSVIERRAVHVTDLLAESDAEFAMAKAYAARFGYRTSVASPLAARGERDRSDHYSPGGGPCVL